MFKPKLLLLLFSDFSLSTWLVILYWIGEGKRTLKRLLYVLNPRILGRECRPLKIRIMKNKPNGLCYGGGSLQSGLIPRPMSPPPPPVPRQRVETDLSDIT